MEQGRFFAHAAPGTAEDDRKPAESAENTHHRAQWWIVQVLRNTDDVHGLLRYD